MPLCAAPPARAQSWVLDPKQSTAQCQWDGFGHEMDGPRTYHNSWSWFDWNGFPEYGYGLAGLTLGGSIKGFSTSTVTQSLVYVWDSGTDEDGNPNPPTPPPAKAYFLLRGDAEESTQASILYWDGSLLSGLFTFHTSVDDGLGDAPVVSGPIYSQGEDGNHVFEHSKSQGSHLVQKDGSSGTVTLNFNVNAHSDATLSAPSEDSSHQWIPFPAGNGATEAHPVQVEIVEAPKVMITSPIEDSYYKGGADPETMSYRQQNFRKPDGSISVDAAASYSAADRNRQWVGSATFTANDTGFPSPQYAWSGGFNPVDSSPNMNQKSVSGEFLLGPASSLPSPTTVTVNVSDAGGSSDNSGATATNTYTVNWHLPYEKTADIASVPMKEIMRTLIGPVHAGDPAITIPKAEGGDIDIAAGIDGVAAGLAIGGQELSAGIAELLAAGAGLIDLKYHYGGEAEQPSGALNGQDKWDATRSRDWAENVSPPSLLSLRDPDTGQFAGWRFCDMSIKLVKRYHHKTWYADAYDGHGYETSNNILFADPIDKIDEEPFYTEVAAPPTNWSPS